MKAAVTDTDLTAPAVSVVDVPYPQAGPHWVTVRLHHAALNRLDAMLVENRTQENRGSIFGSDGSGVVYELGPEVLPPAGKGLGDPVIVFPSLFWGAGKHAPGDDFEILGSPTHGTHAEFVTVPAANIFAKPDHLTWAEAAALPLAGVTAWRALVHRGRLAAGESVVVGAASSGVGSMAIQIAAASGARVIAVTSSDDKAAAAKKLGAHVIVDRRRGQIAKQIRAHTDRGADLALDPTGVLWQPFVDALRPGGRLSVVGKLAAPVAELRVQSVYWKQIDVLGSSMGSPYDFQALLDHVVEHKWAPAVDSIFPLARIGEAYARLDDPDRMGKVVVDVRQP